MTLFRHPGPGLVTGNLGYHTAHHTRHGLHWPKLHALHALMARGIPATLYRAPGIPFVGRGTEAKVELSAEQVAAPATQRTRA